MDADNPVLTPEQIAQRWDVSDKTVRNMLNEGTLRGFRVGGKYWRVRREQLEEYELCQTGDLQDTQDNGALPGTNQTEPDADTSLEPQTDAKQRRKPRLDTQNSRRLKVVT